MTEIYMGLLDDQVLKYPWNNSVPSTKWYLDHLMYEIVIGRKPVINDGYLLQNEIIRSDLFKNNDSFFLELAKSGQIIIPGRCESFELLIQEHKNAGVPSFLEIPNYVCDRLGVIDEQLTKYGARIEGPDSMSVWEGFHGHMVAASQKDIRQLGLCEASITENDFTKVMDAFLSTKIDATTNRPPSRGQWESALTALTKSNQLSNGNSTKKALMHFANEAYHYNFAQQLTLKQKKTVAVQTALSPAFSHLLERKTPEISLEPKKIPLIQIPWPNKLCTKDALNELLGDTELGAARKNFIDALTNYQLSTSSTSINNLRYASNEYNKLINQELGLSIEIASSARRAHFFFTIVTAPGDAGLSSLFLEWVVVEAGIKIWTHIAMSKSKEIDYLNRHIVAAPVTPPQA